MRGYQRQGRRWLPGHAAALMRTLQAAAHDEREPDPT